MVFQRGAERSLCGVAVVALLGLTAPPLLAQPLSNDLETKLLELERTLEQQRLEIQALREELLELQRGRGPVDTGVRQAQQSPPPAQPPRQQQPPQQLPPQQPVGQPRSDEHTSELQSQMHISYAVFCLYRTNHIT